MEQLEQSRISRREGGTRAGSRASQGVNYARKQYYRTNYRTGERNSVKCRAAHYQPPLPRECTPRYINYLGGWPIGQIQRETTVLSPLLFSPLYFFFFFFFLFFQFFNFIPLLPRVSAVLSASNRGRSFDRDFQPIGKFFFDRTCTLLSSKSNQVVLLGIYNYWNLVIEIFNYWIIEIQTEEHPRLVSMSQWLNRF